MKQADTGKVKAVKEDVLIVAVDIGKASVGQTMIILAAKPSYVLTIKSA